MICNQLFCENDEMIKFACEVLKNKPDECLVVVDGIDEWKGSATKATGRRGDIPGLPSRKGLEDCVVLSTSRPERIHMLPEKLDKTCIVLELHGIENSEKLIRSLLEIIEYPDPDKSCSEFLFQIRRSNMTDLIQFPLMLINALNIWDMNGTLSSSMSVNYSNMVEGLFLRAKDANRIEELEQNRRKYTSAELPNCCLYTDLCKRNADLIINLGKLAFDLLFGDDQNSSLMFSEKQARKYLPENDLKTCLAVGILSKAQTISRSNRKVASFSFCHKTFQEYLGALWLATEQSNIRQFRSIDTLLNNEVFLQFLCGLSPSAGDRFWKYIAEEVTEKDEKINQYRLGADYSVRCNFLSGDYKNSAQVRKFGAFQDSGFSEVMKLQTLVLLCITEARNADLEQHQQLYYFIPDIVIHEFTCYSEYFTLINGLVEKFVADIKSVTLARILPLDIVKSMKKMQSAISIRLEGKDFERPSLPVLQFPDQLKQLSVEHVDITSAIEFPEHLTTLTVTDIKSSHSDIKQLFSCLSVSFTLQYLHLEMLRCRDHSDSCLPELDLQRHYSLKEAELRFLSAESVLLPGKGTIPLPLTRLFVIYVKLSHSGIEQLCSCLRISSNLRYLRLEWLCCSDHGGRCCPSELDLQRHHSLEEVKLEKLPGAIMLLPGQGTVTSLLTLTVSDIKLSHSGIEQLCSCLRIHSTLRYLHLEELYCSDHGESCCFPELDLQRHHSLEEVTLKRLSVESMLLPGQGTIPLLLTKLEVIFIKLSHSNIEQLCSRLRVYSTLRYLHLLNLYCRDHGESCCFPELDLQRHHSLETVRLGKLFVESVLLPGQLEIQQAGDLNEIPTLDIAMWFVNMSSQGWRSWLDSHSHLPYKLKVRLSGCNIDIDLMSYIRACSHFTVTYDDIIDGDTFFLFRDKSGSVMNF